MNHWLVKSDPETYGWQEFSKDKKTEWTGVRSYAARNHLREMKKGDPILFYHSGKESAVVGTAKVSREFFPDPSSEEEAWVAIEMVVNKKFKRLVSLQEIKTVKELKDMVLIKISRLSVMPVTEAEFRKVEDLGTS
ncbi:MAG: EVE domain-containing protein [Chitinophagales bacterium]|nr:EVE domain-containing protein [Chitinophagales bacterium]